MQSNSFFEDFKNYSHKLGSVLEGLNSHESGTEVSFTRRELVFQDNKLKLYHYPATDSVKNAERQIVTPVLIVYALVNRPTILDLQEQHSAIAKMLENGLDVYLLDWGYPDMGDSKLGLDDYINDQLHQCVETICDTHEIDSINLLGVCQGGVLSLCYSSLHPECVKNLVTMVTPVDFQTEKDMLSRLVRHVDIDLMVDTLGNIPGSMLSNTFLSLKPYQLQLKKYLDLIDTIDQVKNTQERISNFISMEQWIFDSPDQAGETFRHYIKSCYQQNQLIKGELEIGGQFIDLKTLELPILNIYANQDHIVPPEASKVLKKVVGTEDYEEMPVAGGHIGIFVSEKALNKIFPVMAIWFRERD